MYKGILALVALAGGIAIVGNEVKNTNDAVNDAIVACNTVTPLEQATLDTISKNAELASTEDDEPTDR